MVMLFDHKGQVLLERRPATGIWGGLWGFPVCPTGWLPQDWIRKQFGLEIVSGVPWLPVHHEFTHLELEIHPVPAKLTKPAQVVESLDHVWYKPGLPLKRGVAAPILRLLQQLEDYQL